jgi:hypothetical protein
MSASGQKQTFAPQQVMSALPPIMEIAIMAINGDKATKHIRAVLFGAAVCCHIMHRIKRIN